MTRQVSYDNLNASGINARTASFDEHLVKFFYLFHKVSKIVLKYRAKVVQWIWKMTAKALKNIPDFILIKKT